MKNERDDAGRRDFTDEELDVYGAFSDEVLAGRHPDIEEYLKRLPGKSDRLRALLEAEVKVHAEVEKLRALYPGVDLARLLDPDWRRRRK